MKAFLLEYTDTSRLIKYRTLCI